MRRAENKTETALRAAVPSVRETRRVTLGGFGGIDLRRRLNSDTLIGGWGIGHRTPLALSSERAPSDTGERYPEPISMSSVGDSLVIFYRADGETRVAIRGGSHPADIGLGDYPSASHAEPRSVSALNRYSDPLDPIGGRYEKQILIFPDKLRLRLGEEGWSVESMEEARAMPDIGRACVHLSRVFGVGEDRVWVSAYNEPDNFELDTATDYGASSAWASTVQSNTRADSPLCSMTLYDGQVLCFKRNFCHTINNNKNPFRVADLFCRGALSAEGICEAGGVLIFVSDDGLYAFGGGSPERISDALCIRDWQGTVLCGRGDVCYVYVPAASALFTYSVERASFGRIALPEGLRPIAMAATDTETYILDSDGALWRADGEWGEFRFESAYLTLGTDRPWRLGEVTVTVELGVGAKLCVSARSGDGEELLLGEFKGEGKQPRVLRCETGAATSRPCDCVSLLLSGRGDATVFSVTLSGVPTGGA